MNKRIGEKIVSCVLLGSMLTYSLPVFASTKEETVYSKLNNTGSQYSTTVSTKISNDNKDELLEDISSLLNIKNTNGDETFEQDGNKIVWKANGNDIQYQGETDKELPITTSIKYELNGEEKEAKDIVGQSGKVKVTLSYTNNEKHTVKVNGKYVTMYTPFVIVAGTILDEDIAKNVTVSNGKVLDNGSSTVAIGMCMPGLQESLDISKKDYDIPNSITFEMDAENFEMNNIISYATCKVLTEDDVNMFDNLDQIYADANDLKNASTQLVDGTTTLADGASKVNDGASQLSSGVQLMNTSVNKSIESMRNNKEEALKAEQIASIGKTAGATAKSTVSSKESIATIDKTASAGVDANKDEIGNQMVATAKTIAETTAVATAKQVAQDTAVSTLKQSAVQIAYESAVTAAQESAWTTAETTAKEVYEKMIANQVLTTLQAKYPNAGITEKSDTFKTAYTTALANNKSTEDAIVESAGTKAVAKAKGQLDEKTIKAEAKSNVDKEFGAKEVKGIYYASSTSEKGQKVLEKVLSDKQVESVKATALKEVEAQESTIKKTADAGIDAQASTIKAGAVTSAKKIATTTAEATAKTVAEQVGNQVGQTVAEKVAKQVKDGVLNKVASSMSELTKGLDQLESGAETLANGTNDLSTGANTLKDGMVKFDAEGIQKIYDLINGDVKDMEGRVKALKDLAEEYNTFAGIKDGDEGSVQFITTIDSIKKSDFEEKANASTTTQTNETVANETITNNENEDSTSEN